MEMEFSVQQVSCLRPLNRQQQNQEQTQEAVIPDSSPDIGRILGCWGTPLVRSTQWRERGMSLSGGVTARALYLPEGGTEPILVEAWLPFTFNWEFEAGANQGQMCFDLRLRGAEARMISARKLLFRMNVAARGEAYQNDTVAFYSPQDVPKDVELKKERYPLVIPGELSCKQFSLDEELELPGVCPAVGKIMDYRIRPQVTECKVLGGKAVYKGNMGLHLLYLDPDGRLCTWDEEIPFSQYTDLVGSYDQEEELQVSLLPMDMELECDEEGRRLRLRAGFTGQCMVLCRHLREVVEDAYSVRREVGLHHKPLGLETRLDHQLIQEMGTAEFPVTGNLVDWSVFPDYPRVNRNGDAVELETPVFAQVLYTDDNGQLQGRSVHATVRGRSALEEHCRCSADSAFVDAPQWSGGAGNSQLRFGLQLTADSYPREPMSVVTGLELGDLRQPDPNRPSILIRRPQGVCSLWDIAKSSGSTVAAIQSANALDSQYADPDRLLLIPVM